MPLAHWLPLALRTARSTSSGSLVSSSSGLRRSGSVEGRPRRKRVNGHQEPAGEAGVPLEVHPRASDHDESQGLFAASGITEAIHEKHQEIPVSLPSEIEFQAPGWIAKSIRLQPAYNMHVIKVVDALSSTHKRLLPQGLLSEAENMIYPKPWMGIRQYGCN